MFPISIYYNKIIIINTLKDLLENVNNIGKEIKNFSRDGNNKKVHMKILERKI